VVEKIPEDKLSLEGVNSWFKRFGTVTNVAIDAVNAKALVSFSNHEDAHAAWKSEDAVFGNRFVKVFWHRPMEGHGQVGARMLAASAPLVANMSSAPSAPPTSATTTTPSVPSTSATAASIPRKASTTPSASTTLSALAAKQQQLEQTIAEQKLLMASLGTASAEEKKNIMARLRKLGEEMTKLAPSTPAAAASSSSSTSNIAATKKPADKLTEHEKKERERLDKELEMHGGQEQPEESTEDLKAKLERLKAEAMSLGLDSALPSSSGGAYRGYRGRGRGGPRGGYFRGAGVRGGPPRASMKLDNRPKKLLVKGVGEEHLQTLRDWYEVCNSLFSSFLAAFVNAEFFEQTTGQLDSVERAESNTYIVSFKSRSAAEMVRNDIICSYSLLWSSPTLPNIGIGKRHEHSYHRLCADILVHWEGINKHYNADSDNKAPS
jgi:RNA-binding protein 26